MSQPKVFEFAKEIGMSPLALMDKIREWKLPVRSHMAELQPEVLDEIKTRLKGADEDQAPAAKKKKKKVAKKASSTGAKKKAATKKSKTAASSDEESSTTTKKAVVRRSAKVVIRRKADEEAAAAEAQAAAEAAAAAAAVEAENQLAAKGEPTPIEASIESSEPIMAAAVEPEVVVEETVEAPEAGVISAASETVSEKTDEAAAVVVEPVVEAVVAKTVTEERSAVVAEEPPSVKVEPSTSAEDAPTASAAEASSAEPAKVAPAPVPGRKREVVMTSQGPVSGVKSDAPRRNIVGRMDLSRVQPPSGFRSPGGGGGGQRPTGAPSGGGAPRGLRTGFVAPAPIVVEDEAATEARKRFDDRKSRPKSPGANTGPAGAGAGAGGRDEEVAEFSASEFRKREMVFQPKKKKGILGREAMKTQITTPKASKRVVKIDQSIKLGDLALDMGVKAAQLTKILMQNGVMATMNTDLDFDTVALVVPEFGFEATNVHRTVDELIEQTSFGDLEAETVARPPVVTIMGHVDHGKTSLLDTIRKANVAAGEAGGITQHIGAYQVTTELGHLITFIDTPGHEAFTAMRARGANATDIAVIVVAADDGVMPQTVEAVSHAKAAGVPIIVAVNKMDKAGANPDRVKQQLTEHELVPEEWGGETIFVPVSAHSRQGIPELLEQIHVVAEMAELRANPKRSATGLVIESRMDKGRGPVATLLVQDGTLSVGQSVVVGSVPGRVRSLINDKGERVQSAGPSVPVEIVGLSDVPLAGDRFDAVQDDKSAEDIAATRRQRRADEDRGSKVSLEDIFSKLKKGEVKELAMVLKSDVAGSAEAIKGMLDKVGTDEVKVKLVHSAVGGVSESDVLLASTAKGIVVGFNVRPDTGAIAAAKRLGVEIKTYSIVYELMDDLKKALAGLLAPEIVEKDLGRAEVRNTFSVPKIGTIAGCFVADGKILRNSEVRLIREGKIVYTGKISSLKRFKDDVREVAHGYECGIGIENFNDLKVGDVIESFIKESIVREL